MVLGDGIDEVERLRHLEHYRIVGTGREEHFDNIAQLAASLFSAPLATISIVDADRVWLKARVGLDPTDVPRDIAFCSHTIRQPGPFVVRDTLDDARFASNPLVTAAPHIRFYAGAPLALPSGFRVGTVCIMDTVPRLEFSPQDEAQLTALSSLVVDHLELRRQDVVNAIARGLTDTTPDGLLCIDAKGLITFVNKAALDLFGFTSEEMIGQTLAMVMPERFRQAHAGGVARIAGGAASRLDGKSVEMSALRRNGEEFPVEIGICSWTDQHGTHMGASLRDISERKQRDLKMHRLAHQDPLTGLANRLRLEGALTDASEAGAGVTVFLLDLDNFKSLNHTLGHTIGDVVLQTLAVRLQAVVPEGAIVARMRGDGFALALPNWRDPLRVRSIADAILSTAKAPIRVAGQNVHLDISLGAAIGPDHGHDADELIASADLALMHAKRAGTLGFRLFEPNMRSAAASRRALQDELIRAFEHREFVLHYQPQLRLDTGEVFGAEALLRWKHPSRGLLLPAAFLSALDRHAIALEVGHWTIDEACRQLAAWRMAGLTTLRMGVNLFAAQLQGGRLVEIVEGALSRHKLKPADLELEITETIALPQEERSLATFHALRELGVRLAFDDFGTGFASLSTIKRVPLTTLKIDRSFVQGIMHDEQDVAVVAAVVDIGRRLDLEVIAEGVETAEQEKRLAELGCVIGQGFRYGRGESAESFKLRWHPEGVMRRHVAG